MSLQGERYLSLQGDRKGSPIGTNLREGNDRERLDLT